MNDKQLAELDFWRNLIKAEGRDGFIRRRRADFYRHMNNFNGWADLDGNGLEVGSGCYSMLSNISYDFENGSIETIDPLAEEYKKIESEFGLFSWSKNIDGENIISTYEFLDYTGTKDWILNINVIDHTPNPQKMADEMYRVLNHGGKLYFEVNFDDELARPHYSLWNEAKVNEVLNKFKLLYKNIIRNEVDKQTLFYGVYEK